MFTDKDSLIKALCRVLVIRVHPHTSVAKNDTTLQGSAGAPSRRTIVRIRPQMQGRWAPGHVLRSSRSVVRTALRYGNKRQGMSLIEVVLAIAVAGFVLASAVSLMVSVSSIWSERSERYFFVDHVEGVTEFLNATLTVASVEITGGTNAGSQNSTPPNQGGGSPQPQPQSGSGNALGGSLVSSAEEPVRWEQPPGFAKYEDPLLHFSIADALPLLVDPEDAPALGIRGFLHFEEDEGLSLLWYSILQEEVEDINDLRRTLISPLVTAITYIYWDERFERWEEEDRPLEDDETDEFMLPRFIKLTFEYEGASAERMLTIPVPSRSALLF